MSNVKSNVEVESINFGGDELLGVKDESGKIYLAIKRACLNIGLSEDQARNEIKKISDSDLFKLRCVKFDTPQKQGDRTVLTSMLFLEEKYVPMWLAQINITPKMKIQSPEVCDKLLKYQEECVDVLHKHFMGNEDKKKDFYDRFGLKGVIEDAIKIQVQPLVNEVNTLKKTVNENNNYIIKLTNRHKIFTNESSLFTNLLINFNAKIYDQGMKGKQSYNKLYEAISSFTGIYIPINRQEAISKGYSSIKEYVIKTFGIDFLIMFNEAILDDRIVRTKSGEFIDMSGVFQNDYEWNKVLKYYTDGSGNIRCAYCIKIININDVQKEHLIPQSHVDSSDRIENITVSCSDCNREKYDQRYDEWYPRQSFFKESIYNYLLKHIDKYKI